MRIGFLTGNDGLFAWGRFLIFSICRIRIREMKHGNRDPARHGGVLLLLTFEPCGRIFPHRLQTAALGPTSLTSENGLD